MYLGNIRIGNALNAITHLHIYIYNLYTLNLCIKGRMLYYYRLRDK